MGFGARSDSVSRPSRKVNDDAARSRCLGLGLWSKDQKVLQSIAHKFLSRWELRSLQIDSKNGRPAGFLPIILLDRGIDRDPRGI
jgi:hypothetical protein